MTPFTSGFGTNPFAAADLAHFVTTLSGLDQPPAWLIPIYKAAASRYHVPWQILAAINAIETDYGRDLQISPAGAIGWMQFLPGTWVRWGIAIGRDNQPEPGIAPDPNNPRDAIFSAARYLAASGAPMHIRRAVFAYNHARWYVDAVIWWAHLILDRSVGDRIRNDGYALPLAGRFMRQLGRTDDGIDIEDAPDGAAVFSITTGVVTAVANDPAGFGPNYPVVKATRGPLKGQYIYYGHVAASLVRVGQHVQAGQPIAVMGHTGNAASLGHGHIEVGFSDASGDPLSHGSTTAPSTPAGVVMRHLLVALSHSFGIDNS